MTSPFPGGIPGSYAVSGVTEAAAAQTESVTVDGNNLDQLLAMGVDGISKLMSTAGTRGTDLTIPGRHGQRYVPGKRSQSLDLALPLWVRGVGRNGELPGGDAATRVAFFDRVRDIVAMFPLAQQVTIRHTLGDGDAREIQAEVTDVMDWTVRGTGRHTLGQVSVGLHCADPFWRDLADSSGTITAAAGTSASLAGFAGASAPMEDLQVRFGPSTNPRITQPSTGIYVGWNGVIPSGQTLVVDTAGWRVYGDGGLVVIPADYSRLYYGGAGTSRWFALTPQPGGPAVSLGHTSAGSATAIVTGRRRHRIA